MAAPPTAAPSTAGPDAARDARLDGLRGIAILLVVFYHASFFWLAESPAEIALVLLPAMGLYGVDLFFVLSGFLITGILLRTRGGPGYFRTFYARRALRIFPAYYAVLVLFLFVFPWLTPQAEGFWKADAPRETWWYWTYLSNFQVAASGRFQHHFLFVSWSLAIEEQFYLVWPLVVSLLSRRNLARLSWGIFAGAFALRCGLVWADASPLVPYVLTPCRLDALATGALIALAVGEPDALARLTRAARVGLPAAAALFVGFVVWRTFGPETGAAGAPTGLLDGEARLLFYTSHPFVLTVGYSALCVLFGSLLLLALASRDGPLARALRWGPLLSFGRYSYGIYLLHRLAVAIARNVVEPTQADSFLTSQVAFWGVALALSWGLAWVSWQVLEAPILSLKERFPYAS